MDRRRVIAGALALSGTIVRPAEAQARLMEHRIKANGYDLFVRVEAGQDPNAAVIVLESGGGLDSTQWSTLQPQLAAATGATVVSYDRPGFGQSPLPDRPYDLVDEATAFHTALEGLGLAKRVLLVGHSYGGLLIQLYANRWPSTVSGLLFLDPNSPTAMLAMGAEGRPTPIKNPQTPRQRANARIDGGFEAALVSVYQAPLPPNVPVIVVSSETPPFPTPRLNRVFKLSHELLAASVADGKNITAIGSNHMIPAQRPDLVVASIQELVAKR